MAASTPPPSASAAPPAHSQPADRLHLQTLPFDNMTVSRAFAMTMSTSRNTVVILLLQSQDAFQTAISRAGHSSSSRLNSAENNRHRACNSGGPTFSAIGDRYLFCQPCSRFVYLLSTPSRCRLLGCCMLPLFPAVPARLPPPPAGLLAEPDPAPELGVWEPLLPSFFVEFPRSEEVDPGPLL